MTLETARARANHSRYAVSQGVPHYESFFQRANHPTRPLAFWIRFTRVLQAGRASDAHGELWAVFFDGETGKHTVAKSEVPLSRCTFGNDRFEVAIDGAHLGPGKLAGTAASGGHSITFDLTFTGGEPSLFLLPLKFYDTKLPKAKSLVAMP